MSTRLHPRIDLGSGELVVQGSWAEVLRPGPVHRLEHALSAELDELSAVRSRNRLRRSRVYLQHEAEIDRLLHGFEWRFGQARAPGEHGSTGMRAVAWNCERGKRYPGVESFLRTDPRVRAADFLLLTEVDIGMGRSGNRDVPAELAAALGYDYVFANFHVVLAPGDRGEREHRTHNALGLHGAALLSRYPITRFAAVGLPEHFDKFECLEKRLGTKRALFCEVALPDGPLTVVIVHLDPFCGPRHRAHQARLVVDALGRFGGRRVLLGGDLNTHTYDFDSKLALARDTLHKLARFGVAGTVRQYMTPDHVFEREVFRAFRSAQITFDPFTDPDHGSLCYDLNDPDVVGKSLDEVPRAVIRWLERRLAPWNGSVPMRFDWFGGRGIRALRAETLPKPRHEGRAISDHAPLVLDFVPAPLHPDRTHP